MARRASRAYARAARVLERHRARLLRRKGVVAVALGPARRHGRWDHSRDVCIRIFVEAKLDPDDLQPSQKLPRTIDGVPVDVVEGQVESLSCADVAGENPPPLNQVARPLQGGLAIRADVAGGGERGTLGAILEQRQSHQLLGSVAYHYALTAHHVLSQKSCSTELAYREMQQPGPTERYVGVVPPENGAYRDRHVDAGVFYIPPEVVGDSGIFGGVLGLGRLSNNDAPIARGLKVRKVGARTGCTQGAISHDDLKATFLCEGADGSLHPIRMRKQLLIDPVRADANESFAEPGDSGALVVDGYNRPVGLLHGRVRMADGRSAGIATPLALLRAKWPDLELLRGDPA